jgi:uncharacterized protein (DUF58 family)
MAVSGLLGWANIRGLRVECTVPDEVYCGAPTLVTVRLKNCRRLLPSFLLRLRLMDGSVSFPLVGRGADASASFSQLFPERGEHGVGLCVVSSPFPVNFFVRSVTAVLDTTAVVFPAPRPLAAALYDDRQGDGAGSTALRKGHDGEVQKISDYSGAEPLKMIHWRLSARHDQLKVKEASATAVVPVIVDPSLLPGDGLEERLRTAAFLINRLMRSNRPVGLKIPGETVPAALSRHHRLRLLRELAMYGKD